MCGIQAEEADRAVGAGVIQSAGRGLEDVDGGGEWIYSEDFARRDNLFSPELKTVSGRLYATAGYHVAPLKEEAED